MATITKTITESGGGGDYTTIQGWIDDLDESSIYSSGDLAIGVVSGDHEISTSVVFNLGGDVGLTQARITVAEANRHDGTEGTGVTLTVSTSTNYCWNAGAVVSGDGNMQRSTEWLEWDYEDTNHGGDQWITFGDGGGSSILRSGAFSHCLVHSVDAGSNIGRIVDGGGWWACFNNNILYDMTGTNTTWFQGYRYSSSIYPQLVCNNTIYNINAGNNVAAFGNVAVGASSYYSYIANNIGVGTTCTAGGCTAKDFDLSGEISTGQGSNNLSSDSTAEDAGADSLADVPASNLFVSTSDPKDLHLKSGADAIGAGADLGTGVTIYGQTIGTTVWGTPINIDIDGRDRDAEGDDWDIGADQFVSAAAKIAKSFLLFVD